jgi:hypothetical protein
MHRQTPLGTSLVAVMAAFALGGCAVLSPEPPKTETGLARNRDQRLEQAYETYRRRGFSDERARAAASKDVPLVETTYSTSTLTGGPAEKDSFDAGLEKFAKDRSR